MRDIDYGSATGRQTRSASYLDGLTLIPAWISNPMPSKGCDEITYPFPNFNGATVEVSEWISNFRTYVSHNYMFTPLWNKTHCLQYGCLRVWSETITFDREIFDRHFIAICHQSVLPDTDWWHQLLAKWSAVNTIHKSNFFELLWHNFKQLYIDTSDVPLFWHRSQRVYYILPRHAIELSKLFNLWSVMDSIFQFLRQCTTNSPHEKLSP